MWNWKADFRKMALTLSFYLLFAAIFLSLEDAPPDWAWLSFLASFAILVFALLFRYDPEKYSQPADQGRNEPD